MEAVKQALAAGHAVTAVIRDPAKMTITQNNLTVVTANIFDPETLKPHFSGQDAVISCLGFKPQKPVT